MCIDDRDQLGNISSSSVHKSSKGLQFSVETRFPLFGGWKIDFYIGYTLFGGNGNKNDIFYRDSEVEKYVLKIPTMTVFDCVSVEESLTKIILPEGSADIQVVLPEILSGSRHTVQLQSSRRCASIVVWVIYLITNH